MGYFANLYLTELKDDDGAVSVTTRVFGAEIGGRGYFTWGTGERPANLTAFAEGTIFSDVEMRLLPSYPRVERSRSGDDSDHCLVDENFAPRRGDDPVVFHFLLPRNFVPRPDLAAPVQPRAPFVGRTGDRLFLTYPVIGAAEFRFWVARLESGRTLETYDLTTILADRGPPREVAIEFQLGPLRLKF